MPNQIAADEFGEFITATFSKNGKSLVGNEAAEDLEANKIWSGVTKHGETLSYDSETKALSVHSAEPIPVAATPAKPSERSFSVVVDVAANFSHVASASFGYITSKKAWSGEGMAGYEVATKSVTKYNRTIVGKPEKAEIRKFVVTCTGNQSVIFFDSGDIPHEMIDLKYLKKGTAPLNPKIFFYDLWWAACRKVDHKFTSKALKDIKSEPGFW